MGSRKHSVRMTRGHRKGSSRGGPPPGRGQTAEASRPGPQPWDGNQVPGFHADGDLARTEGCFHFLKIFRHRKYTHQSLLNTTAQKGQD